ADSTGELDSSAAIQAAINYVRDNNRVLWFPAGTYLVSQRLEVDQPDNNANFPVVMMGSTVDPERRAVIRLAPNSPGFNDPNNRRVVLHFFNIGTADNESGNTD
ncbi:glycosyl hydrolase family 28-related protein, partial [Arthrospira platensis SPKY1]|nr:glycosyl hydrolase family 28-related protein [Arthrospira platensis SPKY1]